MDTYLTTFISTGRSPIVRSVIWTIFYIFKVKYDLY